MIRETMNILKERHVGEKEAAKLVKEHYDQAAVLNFLGHFQTRK